MAQQILPPQLPLKHPFPLPIRVEQHDLLPLQPYLCRGFQNRRHQLRLRKHKLRLGRAQCVRQFVSRVSRVRACIDATCCYDAEEKDWVPDVVERVDADAIAALEAYGPETSGELTDGFEGAAGGDIVVGGVKGGDVDLVNILAMVFRNGFN